MSSVALPSSWLGHLPAWKRAVDRVDWIIFLRYYDARNHSFEGLLEFLDDGTIVFPDRPRFEEVMEEEYAGVRSAKWSAMIESVRKAGYDDEKDKEDKGRVTLTHILGFGAGETNETFGKNLEKLRKQVDKVCILYYIMSYILHVPW